MIFFSNFKTSLPHDQELNQQPEKNSTILGVKVDKERGDREEGKQGKREEGKEGSREEEEDKICSPNS